MDFLFASKIIKKIIPSKEGFDYNIPTCGPQRINLPAGQQGRGYQLSASISPRNILNIILGLMLISSAVYIAYRCQGEFNIHAIAAFMFPLFYITYYAFFLKAGQYCVPLLHIK